MKTLFKTVLLSTIVFFATNCSNDPNNGLKEEFYPDGTIKEQYTLKNGKREGKSITYDEKGRIVSTADYVGDIREGQVITYNPATGKVTAKATFKNDMQNGPVTLCYTDGKLYREMNYIDDRLNGIVKTYWPNGKQQAENEFKMGMPSTGLKEWDKEGKPIEHNYKILVNKANRNGRISLAISVSNNPDKIEYFLDDLTEDRFLQDNAYKIKDRQGIATLEYPSNYMKQLNIIARFRTPLGNTMVIQQKYLVK